MMEHQIIKLNNHANFPIFNYQRVFLVTKNQALCLLIYQIIRPVSTFVPNLSQSNLFSVSKKFFIKIEFSRQSQLNSIHHLFYVSILTYLIGKKVIYLFFDIYEHELIIQLLYLYRQSFLAEMMSYVFSYLKKSVFLIQPIFSG